jgi:hypothetical protein
MYNRAFKVPAQLKRRREDIQPSKSLGFGTLLKTEADRGLFQHPTG